METKKTIKKTTKKIATKKVVDIKELQRGDTIYIENKEDATPYLLIDKGTGNECFILIEDLNTHFGYLYHFTTLYKSI